MVPGDDRWHRRPGLGYRMEETMRWKAACITLWAALFALGSSIDGLEDRRRLALRLGNSPMEAVFDGEDVPSGSSDNAYAPVQFTLSPPWVSYLLAPLEKWGDDPEAIARFLGPEARVKEYPRALPDGTPTDETVIHVAEPSFRAQVCRSPERFSLLTVDIDGPVDALELPVELGATVSELTSVLGAPQVRSGSWLGYGWPPENPRHLVSFQFDDGRLAAVHWYFHKDRKDCRWNEPADDTSSPDS